MKFIDIINEGLFETDNSIKPFEKLIINAVIDFMKDKFNFNAKITVKKKSNPNLIGDIALNSNSIDKGKFVLHYNPNKSYKMMVKTLIHELTHIKQVSNKELRAGDGYKSILWKDDQPLSVKDYNKKMKNVKSDVEAYRILPWEHEADTNMNDESLFNELLNSKYWKDIKGKDKNSDFIIDNI